MSKHTHHQSKAEQIDNKAHGAEPFHHEKTPDHRSIQLRAYQNYQEKGGSDIDNWLEAEANLKNTDEAISRLK
jgi:hypothetical protein